MPSQPSNSTAYRKSITDAREAWAKQSGLTQAQVKNAYQQAATSLGSRAAAAPPTAPSTAWNLSQYQQLMTDYANSLDQRVLDAMHAGIYASFHDSADSVLKADAASAYGGVFGPEAVDAHVRGVNQRAAASFITRTGTDGIKLSDRVWKANQQWRSAVQSVVQDGVVSGRPPVQIAKEIEQYLQPGVNQPYKAETARRLKVPKDTSMPAMRVARTELQNSFHEGTISSHGSMPSYLGIEWHIASGLGHETDICDEYAKQGFFEKGTEPLKPHPHCFCTAIPVHKELDDVLNELDQWLADPKSQPELDAYYKNELLPILDVEVASVAGAAGGPLLGGYAKQDKVMIDVNGQQVIATVVGEHASKGVLTLKIDPGQGMESIKVWRSPTKVKPYAGPPTQNIPVTPGPPPVFDANGTEVKVGTVIYAEKGQHTGKVGTVTSINEQGGLYHIKWEDGSENNVVWQNVVAAPAPHPPGTLDVGTLVKIKMPEQPAIDGLSATITKVNPDGSVTVSVNVPNFGPSAFDLASTSTFKLEPLPPPTAATPTPSAPQPVGYIDMPGYSTHGKPIAKIVSDDTVQWMDGTFGYAPGAAGAKWTISTADPTLPPAQTVTVDPISTTPTVTYAKGDKVTLNEPGNAHHGQTGVIDTVGPNNTYVVQWNDASADLFYGQNTSVASS